MMVLTVSCLAAVEMASLPFVVEKALVGFRGGGLGSRYQGFNESAE